MHELTPRDSWLRTAMGTGTLIRAQIVSSVTQMQTRESAASRDWDSAATVTSKSGHFMKTNVNVVLACSLVAFIGLFIGCSDLKDTLPAGTQTIGVHPSGWVSKTSADFHGTTIRSQSWDMTSCKTCHGGKYDGGTARVSCLTCHSDQAGPENCSTCHGSATSPAPPTDLDDNTATTVRGVGAHQVHLGGTSRSKGMSCSECHNVPGGVYTSGHVDGDNRAEVVMSNLLAGLPTSGVTPNPVYSSSTFSCSGTYCHGSFKNGNASNVAVWNISSTGTCGTCHGTTSGSTNQEKALPGGSHPIDLACSTCHGGVINASGTIINAAKHVDGRLNYLGVDQAF